MNVSVCSELLLLPLLALNSVTTLSAPWKSHSPFLVFRGQYSYGTISYQESSWFELLYIDLSLLLPWKTTFLSCAFGIAVPFTRIPFPLETLWLTLSESRLNSSVSLILDFCHLLIFPQTSKKSSAPMFCYTAVVNCVRKPWNSITWVMDRLLWPLLESPDDCAAPSSPGLLKQKRSSEGAGEEFFTNPTLCFYIKVCGNQGCVSPHVLLMACPLS